VVGGLNRTWQGASLPPLFLRGIAKMSKRMMNDSQAQEIKGFNTYLAAGHGRGRLKGTSKNYTE
jgi:hypothetical protein